MPHYFSVDVLVSVAWSALLALVLALDLDREVFWEDSDLLTLVKMQIYTRVDERLARPFAVDTRRTSLKENVKLHVIILINFINPQFIFWLDTIIYLKR